MILRLSHGQSRVIAVPAPPLVIRVLLNQLPPPQVRTIKVNDKLVILLQKRGNINTLRNEHVIRLQDSGAVELDSRKCVQAVKGQDSLLASILNRNAGSLEFEGGLVSPLGLADPLDVELVLADERVGDQTMVEEVEVDIGRELGDGEELAVFLVGLSELPVLVDGDHRAGRHGCV